MQERREGDTSRKERESKKERQRKVERQKERKKETNRAKDRERERRREYIYKEKERVKGKVTIFTISFPSPVKRSTQRAKSAPIG